MKKILVLAVLLGFVLKVNSETKIYKYKDADGNVHYTDKKPSANAKEAKLKSISVVESMRVEPATTRRRAEHQQKKSASLFENFTIATPKQDSSIWGTGGNVYVSVNFDGELPSNYRIKFFLDGSPHGKVKSKSQLIADVIRGEHVVYAQVMEANSRTVIKTTPKVTFYLKQNSKKF